MSFVRSKDYYSILGVLPSADAVVIRAVYRALVQRYHPDKGNAERSDLGEKVAEINEAYAVLSDPDVRQQYDQARGARASGLGFYSDDPEPNNAGDSLAASWVTASSFYPDLPEIESRLSKISWRLAYAFRAALLETRLFEQRHKLAQEFESEFLSTYFGTNPKIIEFARTLIFLGDRDAARSLNEAMAVLGSEVDADRVRAVVQRASVAARIRAHAEDVEFARQRKTWGYERHQIREALLDRKLSPLDAVAVLDHVYAHNSRR
jgi:curved DNA-binding protein CbpA